MKKWWMLLCVMLLCWGMAGAESAVIDGGTADKVHLRASPTETAGSLGLYFTGTPVEYVMTTPGGWTRVRIGSETGYIRTEYLAGTAENAFPACVVDNRTSDWVNLRAGASFEAQSLMRLDNGAPLLLMGETASGWSYVISGGRSGYIVTDFVSRSAATPQTDAPHPQPTQTVGTHIVGTTADGGYIHALETGEGQTVYFVAMEAEPAITREDVNFDGQTDLVVTTVRGATNCYYEFFVRTPQGYHRAEHPGPDGIANYALYPAQGYVLSSANGGNAGALFEDCLYRWDGYRLHLVRCARSETWREYRPEAGSYVIVMHDRKAELMVYDYSAGSDGVLIHEEIIDLNGMNAQKLDEMKQHLWQGLR